MIKITVQNTGKIFFQEGKNAHKEKKILCHSLLFLYINKKICQLHLGNLCNQNLLSTAIAADSNERYCSIPAHLNDETVLALKAEGLITGYGKSVKITDRGRVALRDSYLKSTNALKDSRTSDKFDYRSFSRIASKKED